MNHKVDIPMQLGHRWKTECHSSAVAPRGLLPVTAFPEGDDYLALTVQMSLPALKLYVSEKIEQAFFYIVSRLHLR